MFDHYEVRSSGFSALLFTLQMFLAPLGVLLCGLLITELLEGLFNFSGSDQAAYLSFGLVGFVQGYTTQTAIPRSLQSGGSWVWIAPACILGVGLIDQFNRSPGTLIATYFLSRLRFTGFEEVFFTLPAVGTCFYSFGIVAASRPARTTIGVACRKAIQRWPT
jgi:hypothetical protein